MTNYGLSMKTKTIFTLLLITLMCVQSVAYAQPAISTLSARLHDDAGAALKRDVAEAPPAGDITEWNPTFLGEERKYDEPLEPDRVAIIDGEPETALVYLHDLFYYLTENPEGAQPFRIPLPSHIAQDLEAFARDDYDPNGYLKAVASFLREHESVITPDNKDAFIDVMTEWLDFNERTEIVVRAGKHDDLSCFKYSILWNKVLKLFEEDERERLKHYADPFQPHSIKGLLHLIYHRIYERRSNVGVVGKPLISYHEARTVRSALQHMYAIGEDAIKRAPERSDDVEEADMAVQIMKRTGIDYINMTLERDVFPFQVVGIDAVRRAYKEHNVFERFLQVTTGGLKWRDGIGQAYPPTINASLLSNVLSCITNKDTRDDAYRKVNEYMASLAGHELLFTLPEDTIMLFTNYVYLREILGLAIANSAQVVGEKYRERFNVHAREDFQRYVEMLSAMAQSFDVFRHYTGDKSIPDAMLRIHVNDIHLETMRKKVSQKKDQWIFLAELLGDQITKELCEKYPLIFFLRHLRKMFLSHCIQI